MTAIAFHVNAPDKLGYACRLLRKAMGAGNRVLVTGEPPTLEGLDDALWTFSARDFVPHCRSDAPPAVLQRSPIVLAVSGIATAALTQVRVHLGGPMDGALDHWERIIEVVGQGEPERAQARDRWRQYSAQGYALSHHDIIGTGLRHD